MPPSLREMIPGYNPDAGLADLIPGYAPAAPQRTLLSAETQQMEDKAAVAGMSEFGKGYKSTRLSTDASYLAGQESTLRRSGDVAGANVLREQADRTLRNASTFAPQEQSAYEMQWNPLAPGFDAGRLGNYALGTMGGMAGSMIDSMGTGLAAGTAAKAIGLLPHPIAKGIGALAPYIGPAAAAVPNVLQARGATLNSMNEDRTLMDRSTPVSRDNTAWASGLAQGAIDTVLPGMFINRALGSGFKKGVAKLATPYAVGLESLGSGAEEYAQDRIEKFALTHLNPDRDTSGDTKDSVDNFVAGLIGVAPLSAASHAVDKGYRRLGIKGDGKNGDAIPLNDKAPLDFGQHLAAGPDPAGAGAAAIDKNKLMQGMPPEGQSATEDMNWFLGKAPERRDVILGELDKMPKDPVAQDLATKLRAVDLTDPNNGVDAAIDEAGAYAAKKSGVAQAAGQASLNVRKAAAAATKNKPKNSLEEGAPVPPSDMGSKTGGAGVVPEVSGTNRPGLVDSAAALQARTSLTRDILSKHAEDNGHRYTSDLVSNLADEISTMAGQTKTGENKPTTGDMARAVRVGSMMSDLLGSKAERILGHLGRTNKAEGSPSFQAMLDRVVSGEPKPMDRSTAADALAARVPPDVESRLLAQGIDLSDPAAKEHFLSNMEDFADGTSNFSLDQAHKLLGKPTFDSMMELVGQPIVERENKKAPKGDTLIDDTNQAELNPLSSDDAGGNAARMNDGARSEADKNAFEVAGEEKSQNTIPPESMVFHHGTAEGTVRNATDAFKETKNKNGEMVLPTLLRADTETTKRASETDVQYAERIAPGGAEKGLADRLSELRGKAEASLGKMRDRYVVANTTARALMDRQNLQPSKRAGLFFDYAEKEKNPHTTELREMHSALSDLTYMDNAMSDTVVNRTSLSPSGAKLTIAQRAEINAPKINLERLSELIPPKDMDRVNALIRAEKSSRSVFDEASGAYSKAGTVPKSVGIARIINAAKLAAEKHMNATMAQDPAIKSYMDKVQREQGRSPEFNEVVNNFFDNHHLVTAEQDSNRDHLQMNMTEFRGMVDKGMKNLKSSGLAVKELGWGNEGTNSEMLRREASMNLIRFKSEHSRAKDGEVAIPAHQLVAWVRDMRNAHETDLKEGGGDVRGKSKSETRQTEDYKRDLLEGITALMQNGLTDGLPFIYNAKGEREDFGPAKTKVGADGRESYAPEAKKTVNAKGRATGYKESALGSLPPSLDLNGITDAKAMKNRAFGAATRREEAAEHVESQSSLNEERGEKEKQDAKDKELSQDPFDVQTTEAAEQAEIEANGSKTRDAQREDILLQSSIKNSAADAALKPLSPGRALNTAGKIAETLWRDYAPKGMAKTDSHAKALDRIMAYARSIDRVKYDEDNENGMVGGKHYAFPLAALLTPRHMAEIQDRHPGELGQFQALRSRIASELMYMAFPAMGPPSLTSGNLGKMVDFLSGHNDRVSQEKLDKIVPTDPVQLKEWQTDKANRVKWDGERIKSADREAFLADLAKDHGEAMKNEVPKTEAEKKLAEAKAAKAENSTLKGEAAIGERTPEQANKDQKRAGLLDSLAEEYPGVNRDAGRMQTGKLDSTKKELLDARNFLDRRTRIPLGPKGTLPTSSERIQPPQIGSSQTETKTTTIRERLIQRNKKPAEREAYESLGVGKSTDANDRRFLSAETVESRTAETNARNDAATKTAGKLVDQARAEPMVAKGEAGVVVTDHPSSGYRERTQHNADSAGATVAIAADFTTAGERLTKGVAGDKYFAINYGTPVGMAGLRLAKFMRNLNTTTLNIAGNGIYTLFDQKGLKQPEVNAYIHGVIAAAHKLLPITKIVSGGQTGVDIAGAVAAKALGIPAVITLPRDYVQRNEQKQDQKVGKAAVEKQIADGAAALGSKDSEPAAAKPTEPTGLLQKAIDKRQDYLTNPPADYTSEVAQGHLDWATKQMERVDAEYKKAVAAGDADRQDQFSDLRSALKQLIAKGKSVLEGDVSLEKFEGKPAVDFYADIAKLGAEIERLYKDTKGKPGKERDRGIERKVAPLQARQDAMRSDMAASRNEVYSAERLAAMPSEELKSTQKKLEEEHSGDWVWNEDYGDSSTLNDALIDAMDRAETELQRRADANPVNVWYGSNENATLSNLAERPFDFKNRDYISVEHAYQSLKSGFFDDLTYDKYKSAGKKFPGTRGTMTDDGYNLKLMKQLVSESFKQNPKAAAELLATGNATLTHTQDRGVWAKEFPRILTEVRSELAKVKNNDQVVDAGKTKAAPLDGWKKGPTAEAQNQATKMEAAEAPSNKDVFLAKTYIGKVLGPKVQAMFEAAFPGMKGSADWSDAKQMIRIATGSPVSVMQRAYHESMHGFFSNILAHSPEAKALLERVMTDPKMQARLEALLKDSPKAIESMRADPEERVAYAYQFWAAGMMDVGTKPTTFFNKVQAFFRKVFGEMRETDKALALFQSFHDGKLVEPSAAGIAIAKVMATGEWRAAFMKRFDKQAQAVYSEVMTAHDVLRTSESETMRGLSTAFWANPADPESAGHTGVIDRRGIKTNQYESQLHSILDKMSGENQDRDFNTLVDHMNGSKDPVSEDISKASTALHALLDHYYDYAKTAGLKMGERDKTNFWPVVWDMEKMVENKDVFVKMMTKEYPANLRSALSTIQKTDPTITTHEQVAEAIHQVIIDRGGVDNGALTAHREDGILNPYFASQNKRTFDWIAPEHRQPFLSTDVVATATRYLHQGVRAAEYVRTFGEGGQLLRDKMASKDDVQTVTKDGNVLYENDGPVVTELKEAAAKLKLTGKEADMWVARRMEDAQRSLGAMEGVLGKDISAGMRKAQSAIMVYQGLRVLSLSLFSAMLDPNGIKVAGGTTQNMLDAYVHGLKNVVGTWKDILTGGKLTTRGNEQDMANAATVGAIAPTMFLEQMGAAHTSEYTAGPARKINRGLFLANGLTAWDRSMRIMATKAAMESIASNEKNASPEHSQRWLKDLGLKQGEVTLDMNGKLLIDRKSIAAQKGISLEEAAEEAQLIHTAINRWVNRAIVSPNAAQRPARASDPHFAMFYQLKQFTYSFQKTTMTYALNEAEAGNMAPSAQLLMGMPIMIAADVSKAILTGGGSLPGYMANWTMADWLTHSWNRAGLSGVGQFGIDALHDPLGTLGGPTISQAVNAVTHPIGETVLSAIPVANKLTGLAQAVKDLE